MPLYVLATPLGNLDDASPRLRRTLEEADRVMAEDTRQLRKLCHALGIPTPPVAASHAHNEEERVAGVLAALDRDERVVLVTDAGTPAVSDPGARLVAAALEGGFPVHAVAGPSALASALSVSGFPAVPSHFLGFPPRRGGERGAFLREALCLGGTLVFFEAPGRTAALVADLAAVAPEREACLCRELTKLHEEVLRLPLPELSATLAQRTLKGEVTLVVGPGAPPAAEAPAPIGEGQSGAAEALARAWGVPRRDVYQALVRLRDRLRTSGGEE